MRSRKTHFIYQNKQCFMGRPKIVEVTEFMDGFLAKTWFGMETRFSTVQKIATISLAMAALTPVPETGLKRCSTNLRLSY